MDTEAKTDALAERIITALNDSQLEPDGQIIALLDALISLLGSVKCAECRRLTRANIEDLLPSALDEAMRRPSSEIHLH